MWGVGDFRHVADADSRGGRGGDERRERLNVLMREMCGHRAAPARPCRDTARDVMNTLLLLKHSREDWQEVLTTHPEFKCESQCVCV